VSPARSKQKTDETTTLRIRSLPSTRLASRGGPALAPSAHRLVDFEEFELVNYAGIQDRQEKLAQRDARREEKIRSLDEQDNMKFSHSIQFNAVPDWSSHYIAYSNLKKL
jgi:phosphate transporter